MSEFFILPGMTARVPAVAPDPDNPPQMSDDAYPAVVFDARHGYGVSTRDEVREYQRAWLAGESPPHPSPPVGWPVREPTPDPEQRTLVPYINASRYVADCPACNSSNWVWDYIPTMTCLGRGCGLVFELAWQPPPVRAEVIRLLAGWPLGNRCWDAHKGETLDELKLQGILMLGVGVAERNGLMVAENITMPDDLTSPTDYLERLRATRAKAAP